MTDTTRQTGILHIVDRMNSSRMGNPRFLVQIGDVTCRTPVDSSLGYTVQNYDGKEVEAEIGTRKGKPTLEEVRDITHDTTRGLCPPPAPGKHHSDVK